MDFSIERLRADVQGMGPQEHGFTYLDLQRTPARTGRLRGWVLSAKDLNDVAGMPTTLGNAKRTYYPAVSEPFIATLEKQGAIFIGKSSTPGRWIFPTPIIPFIQAAPRAALLAARPSR